MKFFTLLSGFALANMAVSLPAVTNDASVEVVGDMLLERAAPVYSENGADVENMGLSKRDPAGGPVCFDINHMGGHIVRLAYVMGNLRNQNGDHRVNRRKCRRLGCDGGVGIAICNDRHDLDWIIHVSLIEDYVLRIRRSCHRLDLSVAGQQFSTGGFNVIASRMSCSHGGEWNVGQNIPI
ncbi:hypothetical protein ACHAQH_008712 [Verticillium albo-atrum]